MLAQATAVGGGIIFAIFTAWLFGREFSDHTAKELLALPTSREAIVAAKFVVTALWTLLLTLWCYVLGLVVGKLVDIPGWSTPLLKSATVDILGAGVLVIILLPFVAFASSAGKGYLPSFGWLVLTTVMAQIAAITGWGDWFPWSVPALFSGAVGPRGQFLGPHSYILMILASIAALAATFYWWRSADQTR
jgi:ABC-2 type transport system permease protein